MLRLNFAIIILLLSTFPSFAQTPDNGDVPGVGFGSPGFESGGFIYRQYFGRHGVSAGFGGQWNFKDYGKIGVAGTFLLGLKHLHFSPVRLPNSSLRINLPIGVSFALGRGWRDDDKTTALTFTPSFLIGLGAEYFFNPNVALHLDTPWTTSFPIKNRVTNVRIHFVPNGGIVFYF